MRICNFISLWPVCNEHFPSINIVMRKYRQCYNDNNNVKKFSAENYMDPGDVSEALESLIEVEEMLIVQTFPIVSVYQYAYRRNIINFSQEIGKFVTWLPCHPSSLDMLVVCHQSAEGLALCWLKENNRYYVNVVTSDDVLCSLPDNGPVDSHLLQLQDVENRLQDMDDVLLDVAADRLDNDTENKIT